MLIHLALALAAGGSIVAPGDTTRYTLFKLLYPVGTEEVVRTRDGAGDRVDANAKWRYIGSAVQLHTELAYNARGRVTTYRAVGWTSTWTRVDVESRTEGDSIASRISKDTRRVAAITVDFPIMGYAFPAAIDGLTRWWSSNGRPAVVRTGPDRSIRVERVARDTIAHGSQRLAFDRLEITGLTWGRLAVWIDTRASLVAFAGADAELDRWEAVREDLAGEVEKFALAGLKGDSLWLRAVSRTALAAPRGTFAITGVNVIDGTGAPAQPGRTVVVRAGTITAVGADGQVAIPAGAQRIDGRGMSVIPGLWDMHGHYEQAEWLPAGLAAGVTSVREAANEFAVVRSYRDWVRDGVVIGPRLFPAGVIDGGRDPLGIVLAATEDEARKAVRGYAAAGFPQIKVYGSVPPALVPVIADEAKRHGMTVTGHVPAGMNLMQFMDAGATQVNHWNYVAAVLRTPVPGGGRGGVIDTSSAHVDSVVKRFREVGLVIDPSLARGEEGSAPLGHMDANEPGAACAPWSLRDALMSIGVVDSMVPVRRANLERTLKLVDWMRRQGVPIVLGTDLVVPGHSIHRELELAVIGGMPPVEAIRAATSRPAAALKRPANEGTIAVGAPADLVLVRGDPSRRISDTRNIVSVVRDGRIVDPAPLWRAAGFTVPCGDHR